MSRRPKQPRTTRRPAAGPPFLGVSQRRQWLAMLLQTMLGQDAGFYGPLVAAGPAGRAAYLHAMGGRIGCGDPGQPGDLDLWSFLVNVVIPKGLDRRVLGHYGECLPCLLWLSRMLAHQFADLPGAEWSPEVGTLFPLSCRGWENQSWHFRVHVTSVQNGPSFHVYKLPFDKTVKPVISGSCAGIFMRPDVDDKELTQVSGEVLKSHLALQRRAFETGDYAPRLQLAAIDRFSSLLGFDIAAEIQDLVQTACPAAT